MSKRAGIGRGLSAILPESPEEGEPRFRQIPLNLIRPNPSQPRRRFDQEALDRLAESIEEAGVVQPIVVHPLPDGRYELIAGERRWRAAAQAKLETVPAVLRSEGAGERMQTALIENMAREDLNPVEEARACAALVDELSLSKEAVARRLGRSRSAISNLIRLLDLPDPVLDLLAAGRLTEGHGRALLAADGQDRRRRLATAAADGGWTVRETEKRAKGKLPEGRTRSNGRSSDEEALAATGEDALERALRREVKVAATRRGVRAEIAFDDLDDLLHFAASVGSTARGRA
ncbi:MAG: ParB/RepB/Spo0J family partition protein [Solirubrobacterales bacterium]